MLQPLIFSIIIGCLACFSALANALPNDRYQPINIEADKAKFDEKRGSTIYQGNVLLTQGSMKLTANTVAITLSKKTQKPIKVIAKGAPASLEQKPKIDAEVVYASANNISYFINSEKIVLDGDAILKQGLSQISSDSIEYLAKEQLFKASQKNNSTKTPSRVHVTLPAPAKPTTSEPTP